MSDTRDLDLQDFADQIDRLNAKVAVVKALLPDCPTCGGATWISDTHIPKDKCPDCVDGKVPIERLAKVFEALFSDDGSRPATHLGGDHVIDHLRSIR